LCAAVVEGDVETVAHILMHTARYANASRCRDLLKPGGDVDAIAKDVVKPCMRVQMIEAR